jgi:hypothetical protein
MKFGLTMLSAMALAATLAACAQVGGSSLTPAVQAARDPMTLRAIPIVTPDPTPSPAATAVPSPSPSPKPHYRGE